MLRIRLFRKEDAEPVARLFYETVREVNIRDYSRQQVEAWAPADLHFRDWVEICSSRLTWVADDYGTVALQFPQGKIAGFADLEPDGHIDHFFCHRLYQRCGVGRQLYQAIETVALKQGMSRLFTEASITAKPFFLAMGFSVVKEQTVFCRGERFINYVMEKGLSASEPLTFHPLASNHAQEILNWHYAPPYDFYNADTANSQEELRDLIDPQNAYYAMFSPSGELEGFCCFGQDAQVPGGEYEAEALDIGMGLRPDLTGQGRGTKYAQKIIEFGEARYRTQNFRVTIAQFNQRAQRVWRKLGFEPVGEFTAASRLDKFVILLNSGQKFISSSR